MGLIDRENLWRRRQIILPSDLDRRLYEVHGGGGTAVYALASTGQHGLVSLSMIDAAVHELEHSTSSIKSHPGYKDKGAQGRGLRAIVKLKDGLAGDLYSVRLFWKEHSAKEAGMEDHDQGYDERDYGLSAKEESEIPTRSG